MRGRASRAAHAALLALVARETGEAGWRLRREASGRPVLVSAAGAAGPAVSLSHSSAAIAVAMAWTGRVGIDIERHRRRDFEALAGYAFGPAEQREVAGEGAAAFYRIWCQREAIAKATGEGLARVTDGRDIAAGDWQLSHWSIGGEYSLAIAADAAGSVRRVMSHHGSKRATRKPILGLRIRGESPLR